VVDTLLTPAQLAALGAPGPVRDALRDPRLRAVLAEIDAAPDRAGALDRLLQREGPQLQGFLDQLLLAVGAAEAATDPATGEQHLFFKAGR
jgi:hypothetical protein